MKRRRKKLIRVRSKATRRTAKRIEGRCLRYESLENRQLLASVVDGTLMLDPGTPQADHVTVKMDYGSPRTELDDKVVVTQSHGRAADTRAFDVFRNVRGTWERDITSILCRLGGGDDTFDNSTPIPATAYGAGGNDDLRGGAGGDILFGGPGSDNIWGRGGPDELYGDGGIRDTRGDNDFIRGGPGNDYIVGGPGADWIFGGDESDDWLGGGRDGNDVIVGGHGNDHLFGQGGNDRMWGGLPTAKLNAAAAARRVGDDDQLFGGAGDDRMKGGYGNDRLHAGEGNDLAWGERGRDQLYGDEGADQLWGGANDDILDGGMGNDRVAGQTGNDQLRGGQGDDRLLGGLGEDFLRGGEGKDELFGQQHNDILATDQTDRLIRGGGGRNIVTWEQWNPNDGVSVTPPGIDYNPVTRTVSIHGTNLADKAVISTYAMPTTPHINSGALVERLCVSLGRYITVGSQQIFVQTDLWMSPPKAFGVDLVKFWGKSGNDEFDNQTSIPVFAWGGPGNDVLSGGAGNDKMYGEAGRDTLYGKAGDDTLDGGNEDFGFYATRPSKASLIALGFGGDTIDGGSGNDTIHGGNEYYRLRSGVPNVLPLRVYDGVPGDEIDGGDDEDTIHGGGGDDTIRAGSGKDYVVGDSGHDKIFLGHGNDTAYGEQHNDRIYGQYGNDEIFGGEGNDHLEGNDDNDAIWGGVGNDTISGGDGIDWLLGELGDDEIRGGSGDDHAWGGNGDDQILGNSGDDTLYGEGGDDELHGGPDNDTLHGGSDNDTLRGWFGNDTLYGDGGNDLLVGWHGDDALYGGAGMDGLSAVRGVDTVTSGGPGSDRIYVPNAYMASHYSEGEDAAFCMLDGSTWAFPDGTWYTSGVWMEDELIGVDSAIRLMHEVNTTDATIQMPGGGFVTFVRNGASDSGAWGSNSNGLIRMYDAGVNNTWRFGRTVVHELGHNWDTEQPNWNTFLGLSNWTQTNHDGDAGWAGTTLYQETWWYQTAAEFYRPYGHTHPVEDWATCMEAYFYGDDPGMTPDATHAWMQTNMSTKFAHVDNFLRNHHGA